jgi:hypothetical protein
MALKSDATLADVGPKNPGTYYPELIKRLNECALTHGSAYVWIGTSGNGTTPYCLISADVDKKKIFGVFDYGHPRNRDPNSKSWSTKPLGMDEVVALAMPYL